jgi:integrase
MELLGHSQMRTTMDIYSHVMPALAREAADRMGALLLAGKGIQTATRTATRQLKASRTKKALLIGWS